MHPTMLFYYHIEIKCRVKSDWRRETSRRRRDLPKHMYAHMRYGTLQRRISAATEFELNNMKKK
jgi:hypothetical protein